MKLSRCRLLAKRPLTGMWFRAIRPQFFQTALVYAHTATIPGRFNPGSTARPAFPVLYLAQDQLVALFEVSALLGSPLPGQAFLPNPQQPWTVINVNVQLGRVVDLSQTSQRRLIETAVQELTGDWRGYSYGIPTQVSTRRTTRMCRRRESARLCTPSVGLRGLSPIRQRFRLLATS